VPAPPINWLASPRVVEFVENAFDFHDDPASRVWQVDVLRDAAIRVVDVEDAVPVRVRPSPIVDPDTLFGFSLAQAPNAGSKNF